MTPRLEVCALLHVTLQDNETAVVHDVLGWRGTEKHGAAPDAGLLPQ